MIDAVHNIRESMAAAKKAQAKAAQQSKRDSVIKEFQSKEAAKYIPN